MPLYDLECVAEALRHERDARAVGRPDSALAEAGELGDVRGEMLLGSARTLRLRYRTARHEGGRPPGED